MANKLQNSEIQALLSTTVGSLKPGDIRDLRAALDSRSFGAGGVSDKARSLEATLNELFPSNRRIKVIFGSGLSYCVDPGPYYVPGASELFFAFTEGVVSDPYDPPGPPATNGSAFTVIPASGTLSDFYVALGGSAQHNDGALTITIMVNGVDTAISAVVPPGASGIVVSDTTHTVAVVAGDWLSVHLVNASGSASTGVHRWSIALS